MYRSRMTTVLPSWLTVAILIVSVFADESDPPTATATTATQPAPVTEDLQLQRSDRGAILIIDDLGLPETTGSKSIPILENWLTEAGYGVTRVTLGDLLQSETLDPVRVDLLLLPDGRHYPADGKDVLVKYLQSGGAFLSLSGYAFDRPMVYSMDGWRVAQGKPAAKEEHPRERLFRINTRFGQSSDIMWTSEDQIGVFDPSYPLEGVTSIRGVAPSSVAALHHVNSPRRIHGWAATAMTGNNQPVFPDVYARHIPLLHGFDRLGRPRGSVAAMIHHYAGPFAGSSWGIVGAEDDNLFLDRQTGRQALIQFVDALIHPLFLHECRTDWFLYEPGEPVVAKVNVTNGGSQAATLTLRFKRDGQPAHDEPVQLKPGETREISATLGTAEEGHGDVHPVRVELVSGKQTLDAMDTGYVVRHEPTLTGGAEITYEDNYFRIDGRPTFIGGTNQTGMMWYSVSENPLVWKEDFLRMRRHGMRMLRILHFSPFADKGYEGRMHTNILKLADTPPERLIRQTDAMVQLAQKQGIHIFLTLHDWMLVDLSEAELDAQRQWAEFWVGRYRDVPGIIFDIQNEPWIRPNDRPESTRLYNEFLRQRYGSHEAIEKAWTVSPPEKTLGEIPYRWGSDEWTDLRKYDTHLAGNWLTNRWIEWNARGIRAGDPDVPFTVGYLANMSPGDHVLCVEHQTFNNMHYYGPIQRMPLQLKMSDRRFEGKSFSLGEFGAQEAHRARITGQDGSAEEESLQRYLQTTHYAFGLGSSMALSWVLKDFEDCVFPWGLIRPHDDLPKPLLEAYRNMSVLLERIEPMYEAPEVYLVLPDTHRLGGDFNPTHDAIRRSIALLLACRVEFNVINEFHLDRLPDSARVLFLPVPYCLQDAAFEALDSFVRTGGHLYFSGDIAWDETRQRTRADRWKRWNFEDPGPAEPMVNAPPEGEPRLVTNEVGKGHVTFSSIPVEYRALPEDVGVYRQVLRESKVPVISATPAKSVIHAFKRPTTDGGNVYVLANPNADTPSGLNLTTEIGDFNIWLRPLDVGLIWIDGEKRLRALEAHGQVKLDNKTLAVFTGLTGVIAADGKDLRQSRQILAFAYESGAVALASQNNDSPIQARMLHDGKPILQRNLKINNDLRTLRIRPDEVHAWWLLSSEKDYPKMRETVLQWIGESSRESLPR